MTETIIKKLKIRKYDARYDYEFKYTCIPCGGRMRRNSYNIMAHLRQRHGIGEAEAERMVGACHDEPMPLEEFNPVRMINSMLSDAFNTLASMDWDGGKFIKDKTLRIFEAGMHPYHRFPYGNFEDWYRDHIEQYLNGYISLRFTRIKSIVPLRTRLEHVAGQLPAEDYNRALTLLRRFKDKQYMRKLYDDVGKLQQQIVDRIEVFTEIPASAGILKTVK